MRGLARLVAPDGEAEKRRSGEEEKRASPPVKIAYVSLTGEKWRRGEEEKRASSC
jgi:hypothetical protein